MKKLLLIITFFIYNLSIAQIVNIPDVNFKNALLSANTSTNIAKDINNNSISIDINADGEIQETEALSVYTLNVFNKDITDLTGIEYFTNLNNLQCNNNQLNALDVSNNTNLVNLFCFENQLNTLNVGNNTNLTWLECDTNQLYFLDVSNATNLNWVLCYNNQLSSLNLGNNANLIGLRCDTNSLSSLDVSNNTNLTYLYCYNNQLNTLDLSNNNNLTELKCNNNTSLDYINLKNGNNNNLNTTSSSFENLPNLQTVCVDELNTNLTTFIISEINHPVTFITDCSLGVNNYNLLDFSVYPTPTSDNLKISSKTFISKIEIYTKLGQLVLSNINQNNINISNLSQGFYFCKVKDINGNSGIKKVIKK